MSFFFGCFITGVEWFCQNMPSCRFMQFVLRVHRASCFCRLAAFVKLGHCEPSFPPVSLCSPFPSFGLRGLARWAEVCSVALCTLFILGRFFSSVGLTLDILWSYVFKLTFFPAVFNPFQCILISDTAVCRFRLRSLTWVSSTAPCAYLIRAVCVWARSEHSCSNCFNILICQF